MVKFGLIPEIVGRIPMLVTLDGIVTPAIFLQLEKAEFPMLVTLDGIVIFVRLLHKLKA